MGFRSADSAKGTMSRQSTSIGRNLILYDDDLISHIDADLFEPSHWPDAEGTGGTGSGGAKTDGIASFDSTI